MCKFKSTYYVTRSDVEERIVKGLSFRGHRCSIGLRLKGRYPGNIHPSFLRIASQAVFEEDKIDTDISTVEQRHVSLRTELAT